MSEPRTSPACHPGRIAAPAKLSRWRRARARKSLHRGLAGRLLALPLVLSLCDGAAAQLPRFELDRDWPQIPMADNWLTGGLGGMCIDERDHVWLLNRQNVVPEDLDGARLAPPVLELDASGAVVNGWGDLQRIGPRLHDCHVDTDGNVWLVPAGTGYIQKYTPGGDLLVQIGESGVFDSSDGSREGRPLNSDSARFFLPAAVDVDRDNGDIYVADGELPGGNARIAVLDAQGVFLRQWPLHRADSEPAITPLPHCLRLSRDGLVYVCDRRADRIQVFDKQGGFIRNLVLGFEALSPVADRPSGTRGSAVVLAFSADPEQRYLYVVNQNSVTVQVLERRDGRLLTEFGGGPGRYPGQFTLPHGIAVDSRGNVYVAEQEGRRVQRFNLVR